MVTIADRVIGSMEWASYEVFNGSAESLGLHLTEFLADTGAGDRAQLWELVENRVFAQDDIASAAEPVITVLLASLVDDRPTYVRIAVLDLLFHLVHAASYRDDSLGQRCVREAACGAWLLVRLAESEPGGVREACLEVLDVVSPRCADFARIGR